MNKKILIIDDELPIRLLLKNQLQRSGFSVVTAQDGSTGLEIAAQELPDLIVLDVMMPGMDGFEVCRKIRNHPALAATPVIFITASMTRENRVRAFEAGANDYVTKPFRTDELLAHITAVLRDKQTPQGRGRVVALFSPVRGVGTTTLAIQLSKAMAIREDRPVILIDLDLPCGSIATLLKLYHEPNIYELLSQPTAQLTLSLIRSYTQQHRTNLLVIPAPGQPVTNGHVPDPQRLQPLLATLAEAGYQIVLDLGSAVNNLTIAALRCADLAYVITSGEPLANQLHDSFMKLAMSMGLDNGRLLPVVNELHGTAGPVQLAHQPLAHIPQASEHMCSYLWLRDQGMEKLVSAVL